MSPPYCPQKNGKVERKHRYIVSCASACMYAAAIPANLWAEIVKTVVYVQNVIPIIKSEDGTLRSRVNILEGHDVPFDMTRLRVPGSLVLVYIHQGLRVGYKSVTRMKCRPCAFMG